MSMFASWSEFLFGRYQISPQGYILPKACVLRNVFISQPWMMWKAFLAWDAARLRQPEALWIWKPCSLGLMGLDFMES